jgi:hypothetical protein
MGHAWRGGQSTLPEIDRWSGGTRGVGPGKLFSGQLGGGHPYSRIRRVSDKHGDPATAGGPKGTGCLTQCTSVGAEQHNRSPGPRRLDSLAHVAANPDLHRSRGSTTVGRMPWLTHRAQV